MVQFFLNESRVGDTWTDGIEGKQVMTVGDPMGMGCTSFAFSTFAGGACPGVSYDRHPCCASDRQDGRAVYFRLIAFVPEKKYIPRGKQKLPFHGPFS